MLVQVMWWVGARYPSGRAIDCSWNSTAFSEKCIMANPRGSAVHVIELEIAGIGNVINPTMKEDCVRVIVR